MGTNNVPAPGGDCVANQCPYNYQCDAVRAVCHPSRDCFAALKFWRGGLTWYGGFLVAAPSQLYEGAVVLGLFFLLYFVIWPRKRGHGEVFGWLLAVYGVMRFWLELYRDDERGALGPLSTSQIISIPLIVLGCG